MQAVQALVPQLASVQEQSENLVKGFLRRCLMAARHPAIGQESRRPRPFRRTLEQPLPAR